MTEIVVLIGDLGAGKNTLATAVNLLMEEEFPEAPKISNTPIIDKNTKVPYVHHVEDVNKFLAVKLSLKDRRYALVTEDEVAQSGLEARGSGSSKGQAIESRVISLARKAVVDLLMITQMLSMVDKRVQWLGTVYVLCEAIWNPGNYGYEPDLFRYTVYDHEMKEIEGAGFELYYDECKQYIFPHMDTYDIPAFENLTLSWTKWFGIEDKDFEEFKAIMEEKPLLSVLAK
jgi:energy-coupling factor transporter ATP-binding protein EcfA2